MALLKPASFIDNRKNIIHQSLKTESNKELKLIHDSYDKYLQRLFQRDIFKADETKFFKFTVSNQHDRRTTIKILYKQLQKMIDILERLLLTSNRKIEDPLVKKLKKKIPAFQNKWGSWSNIDGIKHIVANNNYYFKSENKILLEFLLYIKTKILLRLRETDELINPYNDIIAKYNNAINELNHHQKYIKDTIKREGLLYRNEYPKHVNIFLNSISNKIKKDMGEKYMIKTNELVTILHNRAETYKSINERAYYNIYRHLLKKLFNIMSKYYYNDLKYKYKWSYKTLNNSYRKSKIKGFFKTLTRGLAVSGQMIPGIGKYKSKVHLGHEYKISPFLGFKLKNIFTSISVKELENNKKKLYEQIEKYNRIIKEFEDKYARKHTNDTSKDYAYYEVKRRLEKEIRKLKIVKFFLLKKTVRMQRKNLKFTQKKLTDTIETLKTKLIDKTPAITTKQTLQDRIRNILGSQGALDTVENIEKARESIKKLFDEIGVTKFKKLQKRKTLKRLTILKNMVHAGKVMEDIDRFIKDNYKDKNDTNSKNLIDKDIAREKQLIAEIPRLIDSLLRRKDTTNVTKLTTIQLQNMLMYLTTRSKTMKGGALGAAQGVDPLQIVKNLSSAEQEELRIKIEKELAARKLLESEKELTHTLVNSTANLPPPRQTPPQPPPRQTPPPQSPPPQSPPPHLPLQRQSPPSQSSQPVVNITQRPQNQLLNPNLNQSVNPNAPTILPPQPSPPQPPQPQQSPQSPQSPPSLKNSSLPTPPPSPSSKVLNIPPPPPRKASLTKPSLPTPPATSENPSKPLVNLNLNIKNPSLSLNTLNSSITSSPSNIINAANTSKASPTVLTESNITKVSKTSPSLNASSILPTASNITNTPNASITSSANLRNASNASITSSANLRNASNASNVINASRIPSKVISAPPAQNLAIASPVGNNAIVNPNNSILPLNKNAKILSINNTNANVNNIVLPTQLSGESIANARLIEKSSTPTPTITNLTSSTFNANLESSASANANLEINTSKNVPVAEENPETLLGENSTSKTVPGVMLQEGETLVEETSTNNNDEVENDKEASVTPPLVTPPLDTTSSELNQLELTPELNIPNTTPDTTLDTTPAPPTTLEENEPVLNNNNLLGGGYRKYKNQRKYRNHKNSRNNSNKKLKTHTKKKNSKKYDNNNKNIKNNKNNKNKLSRKKNTKKYFIKNKKLTKNKTYKK